MFCTKCGRRFAEADLYCANCGNSKHTDADGNPIPPLPRPPDMPILYTINPGDGAPESSGDNAGAWRTSMHPGEIMEHPEVRARIEKVTGANPQGMTAETFYEIARPIMFLTGTGPAPPLKLIRDVALPIYAKFGVKTQSEISQGFRNSFGETLAAVLCSLASRSQPVEDLAEAANGCVITSKMASSIWSWEGRMVIALETQAEGTLMKASITVPGQTSDWGRTKRALQDLVSDVTRYRDIQV